MKCREAEQQILSERDGALNPTQRAALAAHLAACPRCQHAHATIGQTLDAWRASTLAAPVPDAELEWHKVRRVIRGADTSPRPASSRVWRWLALPVAAAAAFALTFLAPSPDTPVPRSDERPVVARAGIEASVENASPVVFVDDKSGWVFVWAAPDDNKHI